MTYRVAWEGRRIEQYKSRRSTHSRSGGSTDGGRKGRTSDGSQHFKELFVVEEEGGDTQPKTKNCIQPSGPMENLMTSTLIFFFSCAGLFAVSQLDDIVRPCKRQSSPVKPDRQVIEHSRLG